MPNVTDAERSERRRETAKLWSRGFSIRQIAQATRCDWETARRDVDAVAAEAGDELDVRGEFVRLLAAAKEAEGEAWLSLHQLGTGHLAAALRLGAVSRVLQAQAQTLAVLSTMRGAHADRPRSDLDLSLAEMTGEKLPAPIRRRLAGGSGPG